MKTSITPITKIYETSGSNPVLVLCDDYNFYVVKYKKSTVGTNLFNEYLAASFLKIWELHVPNFEIIKVLQEHIPPSFDSRIQPHYFDSSCFGSRFSRDYSDVTLFLNPTTKNWKDQFSYKEEIFLIALFDIWISNEDRNFNNPNLMYDLSTNNRFIPIDHQFIFSGSNLEYGISQLTFNDSILNYPLAKKLFTKKALNTELIATIEEKYYLCIDKCAKNIEHIFVEVPEDWNINKEKTKSLIKENLFTQQWIDKSFSSFKEFLQELALQY